MEGKFTRSPSIGSGDGLEVSTKILPGKLSVQVLPSDELRDHADPILEEKFSVGSARAGAAMNTNIIIIKINFFIFFFLSLKVAILHSL
jgi:hypothetical protein